MAQQHINAYELGGNPPPSLAGPLSEELLDVDPAGTARCYFESRRGNDSNNTV